ncbi:MAG: hypothetical protein H7Y06_04870, partial [Opitutaceae bacterium]|nr:hypothetical protein [Opitutaceae bacterium]
ADSVAVYHAFDEVAVGTGAVSSPLAVDDVVVSYLPADEVAVRAGGARTGEDSKLLSRSTHKLTRPAQN